MPRLRSCSKILVVALFILGGDAGRSMLLAGTDSRRTPIVEAVQKVQPSVVSISSEKKAASSSRWPFSAEENTRPRVSGMGTGVILDARGFILTNHHVVDKVQGIEVRLHDGSVYPARLIQQDPAIDLAMLKIDANRTLVPIDLGASSDLMIGETVITIGNAFGYENTVSTGIISALGRNVTLSDDQVYRNLVQTDACINPGNSGGPLVNIDGELIGINVAVRAGAQGIGFALPIDDVKVVATEMMSIRRLAATWHGLIVAEARDKNGRVVKLTEVQSGSPAETAGFKAGDQVIQVGDLSVHSPLDIERGLLDARPGNPTRIQIRREGLEQTLPLDVKPLARLIGNSNDQIWRSLGLKVNTVDAKAVEAVSSKLRGGLYVQSVAPASASARAGVQPGDILIGMNLGSRHWETIRPDNVLYILKQSELTRSSVIHYYIVRQNVVMQGTLDLVEGAMLSSRR